MKRKIKELPDIPVGSSRTRSLSPGPSRETAFTGIYFTAAAREYMPDDMERDYFGPATGGGDDSDNDGGAGDDGGDEDVDVSSAADVRQLRESGDIGTGYVSIRGLLMDLAVGESRDWLDAEATLMLSGDEPLDIRVEDADVADALDRIGIETEIKVEHARWQQDRSGAYYVELGGVSRVANAETVNADDLMTDDRDDGDEDDDGDDSDDDRDGAGENAGGDGGDDKDGAADEPTSGDDISDAEFDTDFSVEDDDGDSDDESDPSQQDVIDALLDEIPRSDTTDSAEKRAIIDAVVERTGAERDRVEHRIDSLMQQSRIYQPASGVLRQM